MAGISATPPLKQRIAIIGGGMGALSAAYCLTDPAQQDRFDVTVYTMGWRLGGKGASGRNQNRYNRIEEHGLHIWFGTYHNAIDMMTRCYEELGRSPEQPLARFDDAFKPQRRLVLLEKIGDEFRHWPFDFPDWDQTALDPVAGVAALVRRAILWLIDKMTKVADLSGMPLHHAQGPLADCSARMTRTLAGELHGGTRICDLLGGLKEKMESLPQGQDGTNELVRLAGGISAALQFLAQALFLVLAPLLPDNDLARRTWIVAYLGITFMRGILDDDLITKGFDAIETVEMRDWLARHSSFDDSDPAKKQKADDIAFRSANMQAFYDASFSYVDGDARQPNVAASTGLRCILRILFDYPKSIIYEMQAGMGDAVFAPLYLVLKKRGVTFKFFHRLTGLELDAAGTQIQTIHLSQQVQLPTGTPYQPLFSVNELDCWPSEPFYDQILDGKELKSSGANIEHWDQTAWKDTGGAVQLAYARDFELVVLGVSYDVLPSVAGALKRDPKWERMMAGLNSAGTQAAQLWFAGTRGQLGMDDKPEIFGGYSEPWSSLVDFSHLLRRESWPIGWTPHYLNYTCGPLGKDEPNDDEAVYARLRDFLQTAGSLWPRAVGPNGFDYNMLHAPMDTVGEDRLKQQYWRANTDPTERYVIAKAGTASVRLRPDQTGFTNLSIAGEWTDTGVNISSIEATVISGLRVSRGLTGMPKDILGESDLY